MADKRTTAIIGPTLFNGQNHCHVNQKLQLDISQNHLNNLQRNSIPKLTRFAGIFVIFWSLCPFVLNYAPN